MPEAALKEQFSAIEEARADLVALYFIADPCMVELGLVAADDHAEVVRAEYEELRAQRAGPAAPRPRRDADRRRPHAQPSADRPLADGAHRGDPGGSRDGKTYYRDGRRQARSARASARLLAEVQRIKAEGDYAAARALVESYGVHFDPALRDEVVARVEHLDLPSYTGFVMPRLEPVRDAMAPRSRRGDLVPARPDGPDARVR